MKTIKFAAYLFYRYYRNPPQRGIPYFRTIASLTLISFLNLLFIASIFGQGNFITKVVKNFSLDKSLVILVFMTVPALIILSFIKEKDLKEMDDEYETNSSKVKTGNIWLITYCILSFVLVIIGAFGDRYSTRSLRPI